MTLRIKTSWSRGDFLLNVDVQLPAKGTTILFGRSGCGKSSLLRIIAGLDKVHGTEVQFGDTHWQTAKHFTKLERRRIGLVFQESSLLPHLSVRQNLLYGYQRTEPFLRRIHIPEVEELLGLNGLAKRRPNQLSGGQQQRVALGRALLSSPQLLLLDEPFAALDVQTKAEIIPLVSKLSNSTGVPIIMVSHDAAEVEQLADRVIFMSNGQVDAVASLQDCVADAASPLFRYSEPVSIITGTCESIDEWGRVSVGEDGCYFWLTAGRNFSRGERVRLRIGASDVALSLNHLVDVSFQNQMDATVIGISEYHDSVIVKLQLRNNQILLSDITAAAVSKLGLRVGLKVIALIKSVAIEK